MQKIIPLAKRQKEKGKRKKMSGKRSRRRTFGFALKIANFAIN
jgi:hypothetical protein